MQEKSLSISVESSCCILVGDISKGCFDYMEHTWASLWIARRRLLSRLLSPNTFTVVGLSSSRVSAVSPSGGVAAAARGSARAGNAPRGPSFKGIFCMQLVP